MKTLMLCSGLLSLYVVALEKDPESVLFPQYVNYI